MRLTISLIAALALVSAAAPVAARHAAKPAAFDINHTTWMMTMKGKSYRESVDDSGNFVTESRDGKQVDHGTAVMKGNKVCFNSAMSKNGEECWTTSRVMVGHSMRTSSDKGRKITVKRVAYTPMKAH